MELLSVCDCTFEIVKGSGLLYEIGKSHALGRPARLYGPAIKLFNQFGENLASDDYSESNPINLAEEFLEWVFNDGPRPPWCGPSDDHTT